MSTHSFTQYVYYSTTLGYLLAVNAFVHTICLLFELVNATFLITHHQPTRRYCYSIIAPYIFAVTLQAIIILMKAVDLLFFRYRILPTREYVVVLVLIGSIFAGALALWGWIARDNEIIAFCNPPLGLAPQVSRFWSMANVVVNSAVVAVYVVIIALVHFNGNTSAYRENRKVIRRLKAIVIIFVCSWYMAILGVNLGYVLGFSPEGVAIWQSNMVFFALVCYTQAFYVCIWRSPEYRTAFMEQLHMMVYWKQKRRAPTIGFVTLSKSRRLTTTMTSAK
ncbi:unnamed protein product [Haemonchus placei]|uniref:G_PROTEIN_RECEP_F1_2 domain-containing protein n=1 Tax=Haemonchus placei TaxID=6290 RepID=A0A3P7ZAX8_HAEPC|nr:unnamed protein product [Haemonchus placei]